MKDYHANLCMLHAKRVKVYAFSLFLGNTICEKDTQGCMHEEMYNITNSIGRDGPGHFMDVLTVVKLHETSHQKHVEATTEGKSKM